MQRDSFCLSVIAILVITANFEAACWAQAEGDTPEAIVKSHQQIERDLSNLEGSYQWIRDSKRSKWVSYDSLWVDGQRLKRESRQVLPDDGPTKENDPSLSFANPDRVDCSTPSYRFLLRKVTGNDRWNLKGVSLDADELKKSIRVSHRTTLMPMLASTCLGYDVLATFLDTREDGKDFYPLRTTLFSVDERRLEPLPDGTLKISIQARMAGELSANQRNEVVFTMESIVDPRYRYRTLFHRGLSKVVSFVQNRPQPVAWMLGEGRCFYEPGFGKDLVPKSCEWSERVATSETELENIKSEPDRFINQEVRFGTVGDEDFRIEPYGFPGSVIEQDPLPARWPWWLPWLTGLLLINLITWPAVWYVRRKSASLT